MNNQYSRGCGYNYRRSAQKNMSSCMGIQPVENSCTDQRPMNNERAPMDCLKDKRPMRKPLAMGYVPMQVWSQPLPLCRGLQNGTIFSDLFKPFCGKGGACR